VKSKGEAETENGAAEKEAEDDFLLQMRQNEKEKEELPGIGCVNRVE